MPLEGSGWERITDFTQKLFSFFARQEVKTPLSFFFRVVTALVVVWGLALWLPLPEEMKYWFIKFSAYFLGGFVLLVTFFALIKPRNLVYGESGHRAERKMEYGTDKRVIDQKELLTLPKSSNEKQIEGEIKS